MLLLVSILLGLYTMGLVLILIDSIWWQKQENARWLEARVIVNEEYGKDPMTLRFETKNVRIYHNDRRYQVNGPGFLFSSLPIPKTGKLGITTELGTYWLSRDGGYLEEGQKASDGSSYWTRSLRAYEFYGNDYLEHLDGNNA